MAVTLVLTGCGGSTASSPLTLQQSLSQAAASAFVVQSITPGVTPFISFVAIAGVGVQDLTGVEFEIAPKSGSVSKPAHVRYSLAALTRQGNVFPTVGVVRLPVFGLYAGYQNQVLVQLDFQDGSTKSLAVSVTTAAYTDPNGIYDRPTVIVPRTAGSVLGFDFFVIKSALGTPVIMDTDAQIRWVGTGIGNSISTAVVADGFVIGNQSSTALYQLGFDGTITQNTLSSPPFIQFHHNIDHGKVALLGEVNETENGVPNIETVLLEMEPNGAIDTSWNLADILSAYMLSQGDDASAFVRPGVDWFHMNATTYDPTDDSLIVSSRENFLIKLDYSTGNIIWILGDPTKYWYTFPSLSAKALTLQGGLYPIGQHAVSITSDGLVMVFNDGFHSLNNPPGTSAGANYTYSSVAAYSIDPIARTAQEVWHFDYDQSIYSFVCGSAYESQGSVLVNYATADNDTEARIVGLDSAHNVAFDFQYPTSQCYTSWNAVPFPLDNLSIM